MFVFFISSFYFFVSSFFSLSRRLDCYGSCMSYLSYTVRRHAIALSTLLTELQCGISASRLCDHRACISLLVREESARALGVLDVDG